MNSTNKFPILRTDMAGMPMEWIDYRRAVTLYCLGHVAYTCGGHELEVSGGYNRQLGATSKVAINSIIATHGQSSGLAKRLAQYVPPLSNPALFQRDNNICLYCGMSFSPKQLSRDHITPISQQGKDHWNNVVTACVHCNHSKAGRTPEQAGMSLLAIPFTPTHAEYVYLKAKHVLADQMAFLRAHFPRHSPLHQRLDASLQ